MNPLVAIGLFLGYVLIFLLPARSLWRKNPIFAILWFIAGCAALYYGYQEFKDWDYTPPPVHM